jgi:hypothetical protein
MTTSEKISRSLKDYHTQVRSFKEKDQKRRELFEKTLSKTEQENFIARFYREARWESFGRRVTDPMVREYAIIDWHRQYCASLEETLHTKVS